MMTIEDIKGMGNIMMKANEEIMAMKETLERRAKQVHTTRSIYYSEAFHKMTEAGVTLFVKKRGSYRPINIISSVSANELPDNTNYFDDTIIEVENATTGSLYKLSIYEIMLFDRVEKLMVNAWTRVKDFIDGIE